MVTFSINKTTLGAHAKGRCASANNSQFNGSSAVWQVLHNGEVITAFRSKSVAQMVANTASQSLQNWDGKGSIVDVVMYALRDAKQWSDLDKLCSAKEV